MDPLRLPKTETITTAETSAPVEAPDRAEVAFSAIRTTPVISSMGRA
jgi:hypothetical protein